MSEANERIFRRYDYGEVMQSYEKIRDLSTKNKKLVSKDGDLVVAFGKKIKDLFIIDPAYFCPVSNVMEAPEGKSAQNNFAFRKMDGGCYVERTPSGNSIYLSPEDMNVIKEEYGKYMSNLGA